MKRIFKYNAYIWAFCAVGWAYIGWQLYNDTALMLALGAGVVCGWSVYQYGQYDR